MANLLKLAPSTKFKKDLKKVTRQGKKREFIDDIIEKLQRKEPLPKKNCDHQSKRFACSIQPRPLLAQELQTYV